MTGRRLPYTGDWGRYGNEPPCIHLTALSVILVALDVSVWSEHSKNGWVNVYCKTCKRTYETHLDEHLHGVRE